MHLYRRSFRCTCFICMESCLSVLEAKLQILHLRVWCATFHFRYERFDIAPVDLFTMNMTQRLRGWEVYGRCICVSCAGLPQGNHSGSLIHRWLLLYLWSQLTESALPQIYKRWREGRVGQAQGGNCGFVHTCVYMRALACVSHNGASTCVWGRVLSPWRECITSTAWYAW